MVVAARTIVSIVVIVGISLVGVCHVVSAEQTGATSSPRLGTLDEARAALNASLTASGRNDDRQALASFAAIADAALRSPKPEIREIGLRSIASRVALSIIGFAEVAPALRAFDPLRSPATVAMRDRDARVRAAAVAAVASLDFVDAGVPPVFPSRATAIRLSEDFPKEPDVRVRQAIIQVLATARVPPGQPFPGDAILLSALHDSDAWIIGTAARGIGNRRLMSAVADVGALLAHADRDVRMQAATAIQMLGPAAAAALVPSLEAAIAQEQDKSVLGVLKATLSVATGPRRTAPR